MRIVYDHIHDDQDRKVGECVVETTDAAFIATATAINGNLALQAVAGYGQVHRIAGRPAGETRWQKIKVDVQGAAANDPVRLLNLV